MSTHSAHILIRTPTPTSVFARETESTASIPTSPTLRYLDVSPLPQITLFRGAARFRVDPYSVLHARLTGHGGTPTPASTNRGREVEAQENMRGALLLGSLSSREATPSVTILGARFLDAQGDVPEESKVLPLRSPRLRETVTPALRDAGVFGGLGPGATAGWVPTAPVTPAAQVVTVDGLDQVGFVDLTVEPEEARHRNFRRSPYRLRSGPRRRAQAQRLVTAAQAIGQPLDLHYLQRAGIKRFNPAIALPVTSTRLLYLCASVTAGGITLSQFGRIFKRCVRCERYIFVDRKREHSCDGAGIDVHRNGFHVAVSLFNDFCPGLTLSDLEAVFEVCNTCDRVYVQRHSFRHRCPIMDGDDFIEV